MRQGIASAVVLAIALGGCQSSAKQAAVQMPEYALAGRVAPVPAIETPPVEEASINPQGGRPPASARSANQNSQAYDPYMGSAMALAEQESRAAALEAELMKARERLQRVERAMLRLDRRMQLVERNELNRMGDGGRGDETSALSPEVQPMAGPAYTEGFQPVSVITSGLQAAPKAQMGQQAEPRLASISQNAGLPSLADPAAPATMEGEQSISIWTVKFDNAKVWPDRAQLPGSRDVVDALRSGEPVTVYARGKQPNAVIFRDRVKALSRYLSKVSSQETVAISALPADHLDDDTIEIFAAH